MLRKLNSEITNSIDRLKWFFSVLAERIKIEIAVIKILGKSERYEKEKREILVSIGTRVSEIRGSKRVNLYEDPEIKEALLRLDRLEKDINVLRKEAEEISTLEA